MTVEWTSITEQIDLKIRRCWKCGNFWALEGRVDGGVCPACASGQILEAMRKQDRAERAAAALRGVVARMKRSTRSRR